MFVIIMFALDKRAQSQPNYSLGFFSLLAGFLLNKGFIRDASLGVILTWLAELAPFELALAWGVLLTEFEPAPVSSPLAPWL